MVASPYRTSVLVRERIGHPQGRSLFIIPDHTPLPHGKRSLSVGRQSWSWSSDPMAFTIGAEMLSGPSDGVSATPERYVKADGKNQLPGGRYVDAVTGELQRFTSDGDAPLPRPSSPVVSAAPVKGARVTTPTTSPRVTREDSAAEKAAADGHLRVMIARATGRPFTGPLTSKVRARFAEYAEESRQLAEMSA